MHEGFYRPRGTNPMPPLRAALLGARDALMAGASNAVFAASRERADGIGEAIPFLRSRVHVVPIGANVEPAAAERWTVPASPPYRFVTFGVVASRRRIHLAIGMIAAAARRGIAIELTVVGRIFDEGYAALCASLARDLGVADRVRFTREVEPAVVSRCFMDAHLSVHALFEGTISSSGSLLAALAHGVPLLAVRTPRDERAFDDVASFTTEDPEAMLDAALALVRSPDGGAALGRRARDRYERDFAWQRIAERALEITFATTGKASYARG
jgi:glycosyltransferase involved in cell wall biosynthesis